jgi:glycerate kinase
MNANGIDAFFPILKAPCSLQEAMDKEKAKKNLTDTAIQVFSLIKSFQEV